MLTKITDTLCGAWNKVLSWMAAYHQQVIAGLVVFIVLLLLFGCAGSQVTKQPVVEGPGYCKWKDAPSWVAKDFILDEEGWGLMDGYQFMGKHGLPCYAFKVDVPPTDGKCDVVGVVCENGKTDNRHGPGTPLVVEVGGGLSCDRWEGLIKAIKSSQKSANN